MELMNKIKKFAGIRYAAGFMVISLIILAISLYAISRPKEEYAQTSAVITEIAEEYDPIESTNNYTVFVDYTVDGTKYTHALLGAYDSSMKEGKEITIEYRVSDPQTIQAVGSEKIPYIIAAVAGIVFAVSTVALVKTIKKPSKEYGQYDRVDTAAADPEEVKKLLNDTEALKKYYFHYDSGKLKQGHVMENDAREVIYEGKMLENSLIRDLTYEFVNHISNSSKTAMVSHVVSHSVGQSSGNFTGSMTLSSSFKINGVDCWDYIASLGFSLECTLNGLKPHYELYHWGVNVGHIDTTSTKLYEEEEAAASKLIKSIPAPGYFRIMCKESDLDAVFFICFAITKAGLIDG